MRKYYMSHVDFSEIATISTDKTSYDDAILKLTEAGAINAKGKPDVNYLNTLSGGTSIPFFTKLERRLSRRRGGIEDTYGTLKNMFGAKEYTAMYLYIVIMYGFIEWQVPQVISKLPAVPEVLKVFMSEFMADFEDYMQEIKDNNSKADNNSDQDDSE